MGAGSVDMDDVGSADVGGWCARVVWMWVGGVFE